MTNRPPTSASAPPPASTPSSSATPTMPIATPARRVRLARSAPLSANASRNVKIGAVDTRMPVSDEEMRSSPSAIRLSGTAAWTKPSTTIAPILPRSELSTPVQAASGSSTSAASAVRAETIAHGATPSSSATLMNRYEAPQNALSRKNIRSDRRDTPTEARRRPARSPIAAAWRGDKRR